MKKFGLLESIIAIAFIGGGTAITIDTGANGQLQVPNWLWYTLAGSMIIFGAGVLFGYIKVIEFEK